MLPASTGSRKPRDSTRGRPGRAHRRDPAPDRALAARSGRPRRVRPAQRVRRLRRAGGGRRHALRGDHRRLRGARAGARATWSSAATSSACRCTARSRAVSCGLVSGAAAARPRLPGGLRGRGRHERRDDRRGRAGRGAGDRRRRCRSRAPRWTTCWASRRRASSSCTRAQRRGRRRPPELLPARGHHSTRSPCASCSPHCNAHKLRELGSAARRPLARSRCPYWVELPRGDGTTFEDNALVKAHAAAAAAGIPAVADDSGIEVYALDGAPGIHSARYAGEHATDEQNLRKLLRRDARQGRPRRRVRVRARASPSPDGTHEVFHGRCEGRLIEQPRGDGGFGYDPVFVPDGPQRRRAHDGRAVAGGEGRDQPPRPRGARARRVAAAGAVTGEPARRAGDGGRRGRVLNTPLIAPDAVKGIDQVRRGAAVDRLEHDPDRAEGRRGRRSRARSRSSPRRCTRASTCSRRSSPTCRCARPTSPPTRSTCTGTRRPRTWPRRSRAC